MYPRVLCICKLLILATVLSISFSTTFYVSPSGDDANTGTSTGDPFKTIQKSSQDVAPGDTVIIQDGTYNDGHIHLKISGTAEQPITFKAENLHQAKLVAPYDHNTISVRCQYTNLEGLDISGGFDYTIQFPEAGYGGLGASHNIMRNCKIHDGARELIKVNNVDGSDVVIENCEIYNSGLTHDNAEGIDACATINLMVRNNVIYNTRNVGIYSKHSGDNTTFENNIIYNANDGGIGLGQSSPLYNSRARNNIIYDSNGRGISIEGCVNCEVYNNIIYNVAKTETAGIWIAASQDPQVYSKDVSIYNNIIHLVNTGRPLFQMTTTIPLSDIETRDNIYVVENADEIFRYNVYGTYDRDLETWKALDDAGNEEGSMMGLPGIFVDPDVNRNFRIVIGNNRILSF